MEFRSSVHRPISLGLSWSEGSTRAKHRHSLNAPINALPHHSTYGLMRGCGGGFDKVVCTYLEAFDEVALCLSQLLYVNQQRCPIIRGIDFSCVNSPTFAHIEGMGAIPCKGLFKLTSFSTPPTYQWKSTL